VKVKSGKGMAKPTGFVSPKANEKMRNAEGRTTDKEEIGLRQDITSSPLPNFRESLF
jgi:hypothetical protein